MERASTRGGPNLVGKIVLRYDQTDRSCGVMIAVKILSKLV